MQTIIQIDEHSFSPPLLPAASDLPGFPFPLCARPAEGAFDGAGVGAGVVVGGTWYSPKSPLFTCNPFI